MPPDAERPKGKPAGLYERLGMNNREFSFEPGIPANPGKPGNVNIVMLSLQLLATLAVGLVLIFFVAKK